MTARVIAVIGQGSPDEGPAARAAREVGRLLAEAGATVVTGGLGGVMASADAVIAVGGGWGTLAEIGLARKLGRPVVLLRSWRIEEPGAAPGVQACPRADSPEAAVRLALEATR